MKNIFIILLTLMLFHNYVTAQISMQPGIPAIGLLQRNQLWSILVVNNSTTNYTAKINLILTDRASGAEIMTASSGQFILSAGTRQLNADQLSPIQYNSINSSFDSRIQAVLPVGSYTGCYSLEAVGIKEGILAEECISFDIEALSPPSLIFPADSSILEYSPTQFSWIPPTPFGMFNNLRYEVVITGINEGQPANEAIEENLPLYNDGNQLSVSLMYPGSAPSFEKDKWYAWQVTARDDGNYAGKSETWVFQVKPPSPMNLAVEQSPFIKMKKNNPEKGIAPNGILKIAYRNETADSFVVVRIIDLNDRKRTTPQFLISLKQGENLIQQNLKKIMIVKEGNIYEAEILNSRKERWLVQFEYRNFEETKIKN